MNKKKKGGERVNQNTREQELESFVNREIYANQTALIEEAFKKQIFTVDDIGNLYREFDAQLLSPNICVKCLFEYRVLDSETGECESCFKANQMPQEIFEWWLVSPWFGQKLQIVGDPVIDNGYGVWWGRTTTGQAISLDYIIERIFDDVMGNIK
jgi:hypothetical protein